MSFIPSNNMEEPPAKICTDPEDRADVSLNEVVPVDPNKPYDIKDIIHKIIDDEHFLEVQPHYAANIVIGFARMGENQLELLPINQHIWLEYST